MTTLFDAVQMLGRKLTAVRTGVVDSGDTVTAVDAMRYEGVDFWNKGTFLNLENAEWGHISDFVNGTGTITHDAITANSGDDKYMVILPRYPLDTLLDAINAALQECEIPDEDSTSLDTIGATTKYTLPTGITKQNLRQVWYATIKDDTSDYGWKELRNWRTEYNDGGQETLILESDVTAGHDLRLVHTSFHDVLTLTTEEISPYVPQNKWLPIAALHAVESRFHFKSGSKYENAMIERYSRQADIGRAIVIALPELHSRLVAKW